MVVKLSEFKAGSMRRAAGLSYDYFLPNAINHSFNIDVPALQTQLEKSARHLGELNAMARLAPGLDLFLSSFVHKEAQLSSRIEGIQTNIEESFMNEGQIKPERKDDWLEVQLYIKATHEAIAQLSELPLCNRLLQQIHATLLSSGRGSNKLPGQFRRSQNWIGGSSVQTAAFIPPHEQHVADLMGDLEKFLNPDAFAMPALARIGITHYQFETIHPFLDGNGRVGRIMIPIFLVEQGLLEKPLLYLSLFFEKYKQVYYDKLTRVRTDNDLAGWLLFFLEGVEKVALYNINILKQLLDLEEELKKQIKKNSGQRAGNIMRALSVIFQSPLFTAEMLTERLTIAPATSYKIIDTLRRLGIAESIHPNPRYQKFRFRPYLDILEQPFDD